MHTSAATNAPKILVLSDIHLGTLSDIPDFHVPGRIDPASLDREASAIKSALDAEELSPNTLLVPGDLTSRGTPQEFSDCSLFVQKVAVRLGIPMSRVIITYGNHDVDWRVAQIESTEVGRDLYSSLGAFSASIFAPSCKPTHEGVEVGSGIFKFDDLTVIVLNSGRFCYPIGSDSKHEYHHGKIGDDQLKWLKNISNGTVPDDRPCLLMTHHHLVNLKYPTVVSDISTLEEGAEVIAEIGRLGIDLVLHGHRHHPLVFAEVQTGWRRPVSFLCAGSFGVASHHRASGMIPNTFHYIDFDDRTPRGNHSGNVTTFERCMDRSWKLIQNGMPNVAVDRKQAFGFAFSVSEAENLIRFIIQESADSLVSQDSLARLPGYKALAQELRCLRLDELNKLFNEGASAQGLQLTGNYPNHCMLTRFLS